MLMVRSDCTSRARTRRVAGCALHACGAKLESGQLHVVASTAVCVVGGVVGVGVVLLLLLLLLGFALKAMNV